MELFIWMWAFDKRLTCCLKYGSRMFPFLWLVPTLTASATLAITWTYQFTSDQHVFSDCVAQSGEQASVIKHEANSLRKMMLLQEGILISVFFASLLSYIVADRISKAQK